MSTTTTTITIDTNTAITVCQAPSKPIISGRPIFLASIKDGWQEQFISKLELSLSTATRTRIPVSFYHHPEPFSARLGHLLGRRHLVRPIQRTSRMGTEWSRKSRRNSDVYADTSRDRGVYLRVLVCLSWDWLRRRRRVQWCVVPRGFGREEMCRLFVKSTYGIGVVEILEGLVEKVILKFKLEGFLPPRSD
ncbi:hypothetical protein K435DRAFT_434493 [Dendrothele bispora CBS 962.96]|uniref:Uncharacterized protein n=1 Tax=Dendrothele bispora (strain CBS 962.96) TaxID=1314807 RepID=A0A4S8L3T2_DENBC|nr:hypothetical protein K435DRAFT_434493 [Dendrothele bispora CBS 962.96]